jgi:hypothetical protein
MMVYVGTNFYLLFMHYQNAVVRPHAGKAKEQGKQWARSKTWQAKGEGDEQWS